MFYILEPTNVIMAISGSKEEVSNNKYSRYLYTDFNFM